MKDGKGNSCPGKGAIVLETVMYICMSIAAIAFTILAFYFIRSAKSLTATLQDVSRSIRSVENQVKGLSTETEQFLQNLNNLISDLQQKSTRLEQTVGKIQKLGDTFDQFNDSLSSVSRQIAGKLEENRDKVVQIAQWANVFVELRGKWKEIRERKQNREKLPGME